MGDFLESFVWSSMDHPKNNSKGGYGPNYVIRWLRWFSHSHGGDLSSPFDSWCDFCHLHRGNTNVFFLEKCTSMYIEQTNKIFCDHFLCGLCLEAMKEESRQLGMEANHMKVCIKFNTFTLAMVMCQILHCSVERGATPKPKGRLWQRTALS